jgi:hypothetical protein
MREKNSRGIDRFVMPVIYLLLYSHKPGHGVAEVTDIE